MKLFVVSDIHGHATLLKAALADAGYDPQNEQHLLICCGDLFVRGSENMEVLKYFERLPRKVLIRGNHEERLLEILNTGRVGWHDASNGTVDSLYEFFGKYFVVDMHEPLDFSGKTGMVDRLCDLIDSMIDYFETEHYVFLHGWLPNERGCVVSNWRNATESQWHNGRWMWWNKGCDLPGKTERKTLVCGHHQTPDCGICCGDGFIAIDACTIVSHQLNVLVLEDALLGDDADAPLEPDAKVIFLDFDGVLNSKRYLATHPESGVGIDPACLTLLRQIVRETGARLVLSTSWREHWDVSPAACDETGRQMNQIFARAGLYLYDKTPAIHSQRRGEEITAWLNAHPQVTRFVVLDDAAFEEPALRDRQVQTSGWSQGLCDSDAQKAIELLNGSE